MVAKCTNTSTNTIEDMCLLNYHLRNELKNNIINNLANLDQGQGLRLEGNDNEIAYEIELSTKYGKSSKESNSFNLNEIMAEINRQKVNVLVDCRSSCDKCKEQIALSRSKNALAFAGKIFLEIC